MPKLIGQKEYDKLLAEVERLRDENGALKNQIESLERTFLERKTLWQGQVKDKIDALLAQHNAEMSALKTRHEAQLEGAKKSIVRARQDARNARERAKRLQRNLVLLDEKFALFAAASG